MKMLYKHIHFEFIEEKHKTKVWGCFNNSTGYKLGEVKWFSAWRRYCFFLYRSSAGFNAGCLKDISDFIKQAESERRTPNAELRTPNFKLRTTKKMKMKDTDV